LVSTRTTSGRTRRIVKFRVDDAAPVLIAVLICAPMVVVLAGLFGPGGAQWQHIRSSLLLDYVLDTLLLGTGVTAGATVVGTVLAWFTVNYTFPGSRVFSWAVGLPIALPAYISAYTYAHITGITGPVFRLFAALVGRDRAAMLLVDVMNLPGCMFVLIFSLYPYVYFTARSYFAGSSRGFIETARSCGRGDVAVFFRVALPIARPALVAGGALVLMETLNEYGATSYFGVHTMVTGIFRAWFSLGDVSSAVRLAGYFVLVVVGLLSLERLNRRNRRYDDGSPRPFDTVQPGRFAGITMTFACLIPLLLGLLIPLAQLVAWVVVTVDLPRLASLTETLVRSILLAGASALACVVVSLIIVSSERRERSPVAAVAAEAVMSGYAVPGVIIVVGILTLSRLVGQVSSLFLVGSVGLLVYAYLVRYLAVTMKPLQAAMAKIPTSFDDAGALSARCRFQTYLAVHLPLLGHAVAVGLLVVFIDLLKELPVALVLRPFNFSTLATRAFELAQQDRLPESALPAVAIVLIGLIPAVLLTRRTRKPVALMEDVDVP